MLPFRKLAVWQRARAALIQVYRLTVKLPADERFCLVSQLRTAAVGIVCNIAEGSKRASAKDYAHFLNMAEGSAAEIAVLLELCVDLEFMLETDCSSLRDEYDQIERMLFALRQKVAPRKTHAA